jgi:hypothetical protein
VKVANDVAGTVSEAVNAFKSGRVVFADGANVTAHW